MTATSRFECKLADTSVSAETRVFEGYGAVFRNTDRGGDIILPGAFAKTLREHEAAGTRPLMFFGHDPAKVPGMWTELREDVRGLYVKGTFAKTPLGDEARELLRMGAIDGLSIGFQTVKADYDASGNRRLQELLLHEVSIVSMPMNPKAQVHTVKAHDFALAITGIGDYEKFVRSAYGLSRSVARKLAGKTWPYFAEAVGADQTETELASINQDLELQSAIALLRGASQRIRGL